MTYRWTLVALLTVAFVAVPTPRVRAEDAELRQKVEELKRELEQQKKLLNTLADLQVLKQRLAALEQRFAALEAQPRVREARFPPKSGTIRLDNRLSLPATFIVDGIPYRLAAGARRDLVVPAGTFTFEVLVDGFGALQPRATRTLSVDQLYTLFTYLPQ